MRLVHELPDRGASIAPRVAAILGRALGWDERRRAARGRAPTSTAPTASTTSRRRPATERPRADRMTGRVVLALDQGTTSSRAIAFDRARRAGGTRPAGVRAALPVARPRDARPRGDLVEPAAGGARGRRGRRRRGERRRHRDHQPARDDDRLGAGDGPARGARDRVAEPDHRPVLRAPPGGRPRAASSASAPGCRSTPTSAGPKIRHILEAGGLRARAERGELAFGTVDTFLLGASRAAASTRPTSRTPRGRCCSTSERSTGTTSCCA